ncbi:hypothetical protein Tco_0018165 [Tanacetum coccineum]
MACVTSTSLSLSINGDIHGYFKVADLVENGAWLWPYTWLQKAHALSMVPALHLDVNCIDSAIWRDRDGNMNNFSVKRAWEAICIKGSSVALNQDRLRQWDVGPAVDLVLLVCPLLQTPFFTIMMNYLQKPMANNLRLLSIIEDLSLQHPLLKWFERNSNFKKG